MIAEVAYLLGTRLGVVSEIRFLGDFAQGTLAAEPVQAPDWLRMAELVSLYRDLRLGLVDTSVVVAAERLDIHTIATLDRRHFTAVQPAHADAFEILP